MGQILASKICGVKPVTESQMTEILQARLDGLGVATDPRAAQRLARYHWMLMDWNSRMNLTGDANPEGAVDRHYIDSIAPLMIEGLLPQGAALIDVGSGAGFPGLPLAIVRPDLDVLLLDSLRKRLTFLDAVVEELGLSNVLTAHARAEDAGQDVALRERFDVAVARAVASAPVLMELLLPFVRVGGKVVLYKGPSAEDELYAATRAAQVVGGGAVQNLPVSLPTQPDWQHCVLVSQKRRATARIYPRKAGIPGKSPLGME